MLSVFFRERFPFYPSQLVPFMGFWISMLVLEKLFLGSSPHGVAFGQLWIWTKGGLSIALMTLQLRVFDELKDAQTDRDLFPDRPLARGAVTQSELLWLLGGVQTVLLVLHHDVHGGQLILFIILQTYAWASFFWFGLERWIRPSLLLAFATHHPLVYGFQFYALAVVWRGVSVPLRAVEFAIGLGLLGTAWEWARKIRGRRDENAYETYSKRLGLSVSVSIWAACHVASLILVGHSIGSVVLERSLATHSQLLLAMSMVVGAVLFFWVMRSGLGQLKDVEVTLGLQKRSEQIAGIVIATLGICSALL